MSKNKLLHISNNFGDQKIYVNLVRELSKKGYDQIVYNAVKDVSLIDGNRDSSIENVEYHYPHILSKKLFHRLNYYGNINIKVKSIELNIELKDVKLIHAHFLFSDGGIAYLLKKKYGINYVVSVRSTDVMYFFKYMIHLRGFGNKILQNAEKVIFINHAHKKLFEKKYLKSNLLQIFASKSMIVPNAIDNNWFENQPDLKNIGDRINIIYVGRIIESKRLDLAINAVNSLIKQGYELIFNIIGDGEFMHKVIHMASDRIIFHGRITDIQKLKNLYKENHVFLMPSTRETFGLVYIEAMSQGLPVIYCKNQAIDGYFDNRRTGEAVAPNSSKDISQKIIAIIENYDQLSSNAIMESKKFNWANIANIYDGIYREYFL